MDEQSEANRNVENRVGILERWQGVVDFRLEKGEQQFKEIKDNLAQQMARQNQMELHILSGNRDTAELKRSWEQWLSDWREETQAARMNRPKWWQVIFAGVGIIVSIGSLTVAIMVMGGAIKP